MVEPFRESPLERIVAVSWAAGELAADDLDYTWNQFPNPGATSYGGTVFIHGDVTARLPGAVTFQTTISGAPDWSGTISTVAYDSATSFLQSGATVQTPDGYTRLTRPTQNQSGDYRGLIQTATIIYNDGVPVFTFALEAPLTYADTIIIDLGFSQQRESLWYDGA